MITLRAAVVLLLVLATGPAVRAGAVAQAGTAALPALTEPVHDFAGVIDEASRVELERIIRCILKPEDA